jgi:hypothetical protein
MTKQDQIKNVVEEGSRSVPKKVQGSPSSLIRNSFVDEVRMRRKKEHQSADFLMR